MIRFLALPLELRLAILFAIGLAVGSLVNWGVYGLAYRRRAIGPWMRPAPGAPRRRWYDRLPLVGWLGLRREAGTHGRGYWIRPMLVELATGAGFAALYWWEVDRQGLLFGGLGPIAMLPERAIDLHLQLACHLVLISLMLVGTLIDIDEKTIPDAVTVPGTLFGLAVAAWHPAVLLPVRELLGGRVQFTFVKLTSPNPWADWLDGTWGLVLAMACWWLWCLALTPRVWYGRHGWRRALGVCLTHLVRSLSTWLILAMGILGSGALLAAWSWLPTHCPALLTALVGMVAGGGVVWLVRLVGAAVLHREAMGFGDVTLMAMIGALLGWQASLLVFFLAPFAGIVLGVTIVLVHRESEIAYGPFLCLAAVVVIVRWASLWEWGTPLFSMGLIVPAISAGCLAVMAAMLALWQAMKPGLVAVWRAVQTWLR